MKIYEINGIIYKCRTFLEDKEFDDIVDSLGNLDLTALKIGDFLKIKKNSKHIFKQMIIEPEVADPDKLPAELTMAMMMDILQVEFPKIMKVIGSVDDAQKKNSSIPSINSV